MPRKRRRKMTGRETYRQMVDLPRGPGGERRRRTVTAKSVAELERKVAELRHEAETGMLLEPSQVTVAAFVDQWLNDVARPDLAPSTYSSYRSVIRTHIAPRIGPVKLNRLTAQHVHALLSGMESDGLAGSTRKHAYIVLNKACALAIAWNLIARNPCAAVGAPKVNQPEMQCLDQAQSRLFLEHAVDDRLHAMYVLAITRGLRQGELFALKPDDVDLSGGCLSVRRTITEKDGGLTVKAPKTKSSRRRIVLPQLAIDAIHDHNKRRLQEGLSGAEWLFCDSKGGLLRRQNVKRRSFGPLLERAGLPEIRFHDLRHTAATLLLLANEHPKVVSEMLGHAKVSVTLDMYSHVLPSMQQSSADKMDQLLRLA